jgi:arylesterase / paraoxonase
MQLDLPASMDFHPLGAALYHGKYHTTLFVTNCQRNQSTIEIFQISLTDPTKLTWQRSLSDDLIINANAILPISSTQFYVTNDHFFRRRDLKFPHMLESYLALPLSFTAFVDFSTKTLKARKVVTGQRMANGITATPDLERIFIAESTRGGFGVYKRQDDSSLEFQEHVKINGHTDNIQFHDHGYVNVENWGESALYVGLHPNVVRLVKFVKGIQNAPSWIVSARPAGHGGQMDPSDDKELYKAQTDKETWSVRTEFQDTGEWFGGATGAMLDEKRGVMIAGGLYDANGAFICRKM